MSNKYSHAKVASYTENSCQINSHHSLNSNKSGRNHQIYHDSIQPILLTNISTNCYLNAGLQAISACSDFVKELSKLQSEYRNLEKLKTFHDLIQILCCCDGRHLDISQNKIFQNWKKQGQQDSFELLSHVIAQVYKEIRQHKNLTRLADWLEVRLPLRLIMQHEIKCCPDSFISKHQQSDLALHIPIYKQHDNKLIVLQALLDQFFQPEKIAQYSCDGKACKGSRAVKIMRICQPLPNTICLHLQRMFYNGDKIEKINDFVEFDSDVIIRKGFISIDDNSRDVIDEVYKLKSVIVHYGNVHGGHYICYKILNGIWFYTSDSHIYRVEISRVLASEAYILFYEKENVSSIRSLSPNSSPSIVSSGDAPLTYNHSQDRQKIIKSVYDPPNYLSHVSENNNVDNIETTPTDNYSDEYKENNNDKDPENIDNYFTNSSYPLDIQTDTYFGSDENNSDDNYGIIGNDKTDPKQNMIGADNEENVPINDHEAKISDIALNILIEALSACPMFVDRLRPMRNAKRVAKQYKSFVDRLTSGIYFPNTTLSPIDEMENRESYHSEIFPFMTAILNSIFNNGDDNGIPIRSFDMCLNDNCPMMLFIQSQIKCNCGEIIYPSIQYEFALHLSDESLDLQKLIDKFFDKERISDFDCTNKSCQYKNGFIIPKLLKSPPDTLCIYPRRTFDLTRLRLMYDVNIKKSFFELPIGGSSEVKDYKYFLKSIISIPYNGKLECYKKHNDIWFCITNSEVREVTKEISSRVNVDILFFEVEKINCKNSDSMTTDSQSKKSTNTIFESFKSRGKALYTNLVGSNKSLGSDEEARNCLERDKSYLQMCLHAISSCDKLIEDINNIANSECGRSNEFIELIQSFSRRGLHAEIWDRRDVELIKLSESDLSHFMLKFLLRLFEDLKENPLAISTTIAYSCIICNESFQFTSWQTVIDLVPGNSDECLQSMFDKVFGGHHIDNYACFYCKNSVSALKKRHLCSTPIKKTICIHIEKSNFKIIFKEYLIAKREFYKSVPVANNVRDVSHDTRSRNTEFVYRLVSILSYGTRYGQQHMHEPRYCCFRRQGEDWYIIKDKFLERIIFDEVLHFDSFMLFYELVL